MVIRCYAGNQPEVLFRRIASSKTVKALHIIVLSVFDRLVAPSAGIDSSPSIPRRFLLHHGASEMTQRARLSPTRSLAGHVLALRWLRPAASASGFRLSAPARLWDCARRSRSTHPACGQAAPFLSTERPGKSSLSPSALRSNPITVGIAFAQKKEDPAAFRPGLSRLSLHVAFRNAQRPLLAAHVTKREWILSLALTSFKEFIATLTTVVQRNYRFKIPWLLKRRTEG